MKYIRTDRCQSANFSCLEDLKCDIIDNLLSMINSNETLRMINIVTNKDKAFELFGKLLQSEVNGFKFEVDNESSLSVLQNEEIIIITVSTDGHLWAEESYPNIDLEAEFFYIDTDINSEWLRKVDDGFNEVLIFDMD